MRWMIEIGNEKRMRTVLRGMMTLTYEVGDDKDKGNEKRIRNKTEGDYEKRRE